jgi:hypothetical protein
MEADTMSRPETCRIAATPADYRRYGIAKDEIAAREDGFRTRPGGPGTFEWWYFDAVLDDGSTLVINFMVKDIRGGRGIRQPARPVATFELDRPGGTHVERALHAQDDFAFAADRCDVRSCSPGCPPFPRAPSGPPSPSTARPGRWPAPGTTITTGATRRCSS